MNNEFEVGEVNLRNGEIGFITSISKKKQDYPLIGFRTDSIGRIYPCCWTSGGNCATHLGGGRYNIVEPLLECVVAVHSETGVVLNGFGSLDLAQREYGDNKSVTLVKVREIRE